MTRSLQPASVDRFGREGGHRLAGVVAGVVGRVLDLDVDDHALAGGQDVAEERHVAGEPGHHELGHRPESGDFGVVVDRERAVGRQADVELHPVRAAPAGLGEGIDRVLHEPFCATPMSEDGRHDARRRDPSSDRRSPETNFTKNSLPGRSAPTTLFSRHTLFADGHFRGSIM